MLKLFLKGLAWLMEKVFAPKAPPPTPSLEAQSDAIAAASQVRGQEKDAIVDATLDATRARADADARVVRDGPASLRDQPDPDARD